MQQILDRFYWSRKYVVTAITYLSLRLFGSEATWDQVYNENFVTFKHTDRDLNRVGDLSLILAEVKDGLKNSESRLAAITDKCKGLITLSSLLLTLVTVLLGKTSSDSLWMRIMFLISALAFFNSVILLIVFFGVRAGMSIDIEQKEVELPSDDLKKCLVNLYRKCRTDLDNRTDYLVELYKVARFFFLSAFTMLVLLFSIKLFFTSPKDSANAVARELRTDTYFLQSVRGEKGEPGARGNIGPKGEPGPKGDRGESGTSIVVIEPSLMSKNVGQTNLIKTGP